MNAPAVADPSLVPAWASGFELPPDLLISEWADAERLLPEASAARGGRWETAFAPYTREIMDVILEPGVRRIWIRKASQMLLSEVLLTIEGYFMRHRPAPILHVEPTVEKAELFAKGRLRDMIRRTPVLRERVHARRSGRGETESTLKLMMYPGGWLALGGANSANTFASVSVLLAIADDFDRFPPIVGDEGQPGKLLENRTTAFVDEGRVIYVSTPILEDGPIDFGYKHSDRRCFFVPCPHCGRRDYFTWNEPDHFRVVFDERDATTARIECPSPEHGGCGGAIHEADRPQVIADGEWRATAKPAQVGDVGFWIWECYSPFVSLERMVEKFLEARRGGRESVKVFLNTSLGVGSRERVGPQNPQGLYARREDYGEGIEVPEAVACLTAGVDVQKDYFQLLVVGWGPVEEKWFVDWRSVPGDTKNAETLAALLGALSRRYTHALGVSLPIHAVCVDTGFNTETMYDFILAHLAKNIYATKGFANKTGEPIVGKPSERRWGKSPRPVRLYPVNVDDAKTEIYECIGATLETEGRGARAIHVNARVDTFDEEFYAQLMAEHRETRYARNGVATHQVWVQDRDRNEGLDAAVLALAAYRILRPNLAQMAELIRAHAARQREPAPATADTPGVSLTRPTLRPSSPMPPGRRTTRSSYLEGM